MKNMKNLKRWMTVLLAAVMAVFIMTGCGSQKLDAAPAKAAESTDWMDEEADNKEKKQKEESKAEPEDKEMSVEEEEFLDVDSVGDKEVDYSKYKEKITTGTSGQTGNGGNEGDSGVTYSNGSQTEQDEYGTDPVPEGQQNPVEPEDAVINTSSEKTCYLTISCGAILDNIGELTEGKENLVPSDGIIYSRREVTFYDGESVFDVLQRETQNNRIHMEFRMTPVYNSAYIEGINNLYEFDCGANSGWMYCVNGWYPNYGCSRYAVQQGDEIEWNYTCDLGVDLGQGWME